MGTTNAGATRPTPPLWIDAPGRNSDPDPTGLVFMLSQPIHPKSLPWVIGVKNALSKAGAVGSYSEFDRAARSKRLVILVDRQSAGVQVRRAMAEKLREDLAQKIVKTFHPDADVADFAYEVRLRDPAHRPMR